MPSSTITTAGESDLAAGSESACATACGHDAYRVRGGTIRTAALVVTAIIHLAVGAVVTLGWPRADNGRGVPHLASVIILPREADEHRRRPATGTSAPNRRPEPLPAMSAPPPAIVLAAPVPVPIEAVADSAVAADGGREDALALATQVYRRAVMAALEKQRRPVRLDAANGGAGGGILIFRIERSGRLLEASIVQSTGRSMLDRAALSLVRRAAPYPAIPDLLPDELAITVPVEFLTGPRPDMAAQR